MGRITICVFVLGLLVACGDDEPNFVDWATEKKGYNRAEAECVASKLEEHEKEALMQIEADTPEDEIDFGAVDAEIGAILNCLDETD